MACTPRCWEPVVCPDHGSRMNPFGRSAAIEDYTCCDNYSKSDLNPRHLWSEHDSTRWYTDPDGWDEHETNCERCRPEDG